MSGTLKTAVVPWVLLAALVVWAEPVWVSFDGTQSGVAPSVEIVSADENHVTFDICIHGMFVDDTVVDGETYCKLAFPGEGTFGELGQAELPTVSRYVGFARGAQTSISAQYEGETDLPGYLIYPTQPVLTLTYPPFPPFPFVIDTTFYESTDPYPAARELLTQTGVWRDLGVSICKVVPFCYIPGTRALTAYAHVTLTVEFEGGTSLPPMVAQSRYEAYDKLLPNFEYLWIPPTTTAYRDHLIIVLGDNTQELRDAIDPLVVWKTLRGLEVYTPAVGVDFPPEQYQIREYFKQHYSPYWETAVLLVGDDNTVPAPDDWTVKMPLPQYPPPWYAPLHMGSNTWYGMIQFDQGDSGIYEDILVGRLASCDPDTVAGYVNKVLKYERTIDDQWTKENWLFVLPADPTEPEMRALKEDVWQCVKEEVPEAWVVDPLLGHEPQHVFDYLENPGGVGAVNFLGHGTAWGVHVFPWWWSVTDALNLSNGAQPPLAYSCSCFNGLIRNRADPDQQEGLAEAWIENPDGGAIGVAAISAFGLLGLSDDQDRWLSVQPYWWPDRSRLWVGENFLEAKMRARRPAKHHWSGPYTYYGLHWMGDPTVNVWSEYKGGLQVDVTPEVIEREHPTDIYASVRDGSGAPVGGAWVGLYKEGPLQRELLCSDRTAPNGEVMFRHICVPSAGMIEVSAFKEWFKPGEAVIMVRHCPGDRGGIEGRDLSHVRGSDKVKLTAQPLHGGQVRISAQSPRLSQIALSVYDASGRSVGADHSLMLAPGGGVFDLCEVLGLTRFAAGTYFLRYENDSVQETIRFAVSY